MSLVRLMTVDPGHFHAALVQKEMYPEVDPRVDVYAPLGPDLAAHLNRIAGFNARRENPTAWEVEVHCSANYLERMARERPGNVVVLSGRNRAKIDRILQAVEAGLHVLADKPWILTPADLPKLEKALATADANGVVAYDVMTERHEISCLLLRELVNTPDVFGAPRTGSEEEPTVQMDSVHSLFKMVAGAPMFRPPWFFDVLQQGEGLSDVGTHLADMAQWVLAPDATLDYHRDVRMLSARRWPTVLSRAQYEAITGDRTLGSEQLEYYCNNLVDYSLLGHHVRLNVLWNYEAAPGSPGDQFEAMFRGTRADVHLRNGELSVIPRAPIASALEAKIAELQGRWPGVAIEESTRIAIPNAYRVGHEAHFGLVARQFFEYLRNRTALPEWERPNMAAKYFVTTTGVEMAK